MKEIVKKHIIESLRDARARIWRHKIVLITFGLGIVLLSFAPKVAENGEILASYVLTSWAISLFVALPVELIVIHSGFHEREIRKLRVLFLGLIFFSFLLFSWNVFWFHGPTFREKLASVFIQALFNVSSALMLFALATTFVVAVVNFFGSFAIGLVLFLLQSIAKLWGWLQREPVPEPLLLKKPNLVRSSVYRRFSYYAVEIVIASFWFILLLVGVLPIEELWLPSRIALPIWLIIPLVPMFIIFDLELLGLSWRSKPVNSKRFHKYWSLFALLAFVFKIVSVGWSVIHDFVFIIVTCIPFQVGYAFAFLITENASRSHSSASLRRLGSLCRKV